MLARYNVQPEEIRRSFIRNFYKNPIIIDLLCEKNVTESQEDQEDMRNFGIISEQI